MKLSLKVNIFKFHFAFIVLLIWLKLLFSYLGVRLHYFLRHLKPDSETFNIFNLALDFSSKIEYVLLPLLLIFVLNYTKYFKPTIFFVFISFLMFGLNIISSFKNGIPLLDSLKFSLKIVAPVYFFCALLIYHYKTGNNLKKYVKNTIYFCIILTIIGLLFFNPSFNRGRTYLPIYFDSIHTHSYLLVSIFIGLSYLLYRKGKTYTLVAFLILSFVFLFLGYNVRTPLIMYLMYVIVMLFLVSNIFKILVIKALVFVPLIILMFFLIKMEVDWTEFSSGRIDMYDAKLKQLKGFSFLDWLFGQGAGADLINTDVWWWEKKGAHSDIITFLVENGIVYVFMFGFISYQLSRLTKKLNLILFALIFGAFFSSLISNGIAVRPLANYIFFLILAYILIDINQKKTTT